MPNLWQIFSAFSLILNTAAFAADDCSPVRLDAPGGSMEYVKTREQVGGTCFFEVATQLYDSYRFKNGADPHSNSSGFLGAISLSESNGSSTIDNDGEGGYVCDAFNYLVENGAINEDLYRKTYTSNATSLSSPISMLNYQRNLYVSRMKAARDQFARDVARESRQLVAKDHVFTAPSPQLLTLLKKRDQELFMEKYGNEILDYALSMAKFYVDATFKDSKTFDYESFFRELFLTYSDRELEFITRIIQLHPTTPAMKNHLQGSRPTCHTKRYSGLTPDTEVYFDINEKLSIGKRAAPISINICSGLYDEGRAFNPGIRTYGTYWKSKECEYHATLIVGRRRNPTTNRCQYLIRNSAGRNTCLENMSKDWQCEKASGSMWVDADKVAQSTGRIESIE